MIYRVEIGLDGDTWVADVTNLPGAHTFARSLVSLDHSVREAIALVLDISNEATLEIEYSYEKVPAVVKVAAELGAERRANDARVKRLQAETSERARELTAAGYSVRDIAGLLHVSPGRVSQIVNQPLSA
ncbi:hypothetical protein [Subtercola boreus]|uniref:Antitoxin HicB n=1 Tax=Subtercola boreus TaxID=120213 RepID=A0A3E0W839_9MICO|nr:hypothetical protein [Subtercola boreus]RFA19363.1 hypothetical protein B7R24_12005 [Subtercola boreus]RFA19624.1 hypothetical protein B7R23_11985 [Subtercola boreus]RFA25990.1 hypothetical protein B7R25_12105 [Subtercola boreus]